MVFSATAAGAALARADRVSLHPLTPRIHFRVSARSLLQTKID